MKATFTRSKNTDLKRVAVALLEAERPMTLRQLYYRVVSAGVLKNAQAEYKRLGRLMTNLREAGDVPRTWIVDHIRSTLKPSSWTGLADYAETVRDCYRKDMWSQMPAHVEVFVEKDAIAGSIQPVTREFDVALQVVRGYSSVSFAGEIGAIWSQVRKPIFAYYLGDFDPSGFDIERDLAEKLSRYSDRNVWHVPWGDEPVDPQPDAVYWTRLAVCEGDFEEHNLIRLPVKNSDMRTKAFLAAHGAHCAEVDAIPPAELRSRVQAAILSHIDAGRWERLKRAECLERETLTVSLTSLGTTKPNLGSVSAGTEGGGA